ncbi:MAG: hypothetical protein HPY53_01180 [Brevinematales bacterium]|nr:hypothetical protein [Brevinematales bacterium]
MYYEEVFDALNKANIEYLIVGGMAVNLYGYARFTADIDIIVSLDNNNFRKLRDTLDSIGYRFKEAIGPELYDKTVLNNLDEIKTLTDIKFTLKDNMVKSIDILIDHGLDFQLSYSKRTIKRAGNLDLPVVPYSDLIKMKKELGRKKDIIDIDELKKIQPQAEAKKKSGARISSIKYIKDVLEWLEEANQFENILV